MTKLVAGRIRRIPKGGDLIHAPGMRVGIVIEVTPDGRVRLDRVVRDCNSTGKHGARARVIFAAADGSGLGRSWASLAVEASRLATAVAVPNLRLWLAHAVQRLSFGWDFRES